MTAIRGVAALVFGLGVVLVAREQSVSEQRYALTPVFTQAASAPSAGNLDTSDAVVSGGDGGTATGVILPLVAGVPASPTPASTTTVEHARVAQDQSAAHASVNPVASREDAGSTPAPSTTTASNRPSTATDSRVEASSLAPYAVLRDWIAASRWPVALHASVEAIVLCESKGNTSAVSAGGHVGLMQVDPKLHGPVPADAVGQLNQGFAVYLKAGSFAPWSCA